MMLFPSIPAEARMTRTSRARQGAPQGGTEFVEATVETTTAQLARIVGGPATSELCMYHWSSIDLTTIGVRSPFFLHGNKRNGAGTQALSNARTVASGTRPQPLPHGA